MPKDTTKTKLANSGKPLATAHGFSAADQELLEKALRASAKTIAPTPIGKDRNALYASHKDQIFTQFSDQWDWSKTTPEWTMSSIGKIFSNYLFAYNESNGASKVASKRRKGKKTDALQPDLGQAKHIVPFLKQEDRRVTARLGPSKAYRPLPQARRQSLQTYPSASTWPRQSVQLQAYQSEASIT